MAAAPILDIYKSTIDYLGQIHAILLDDYNLRAARQNVKYEPEDLAKNMKANIPEATKRIVDVLDQFHFKDLQRDKSGDAAYLGSIKVGDYATVTNAHTNEFVLESVVKAIDGNKLYLIYTSGSKREHFFSDSDMVNVYVYNSDIGGWLQSENFMRYPGNIREPDIKSTVYVINFSPTPSEELAKILKDYEDKQNAARAVDPFWVGQRAYKFDDDYTRFMAAIYTTSDISLRNLTRDKAYKAKEMADTLKAYSKALGDVEKARQRLAYANNNRDRQALGVEVATLESQASVLKQRLDILESRYNS